MCCVTAVDKTLIGKYRSAKSVLQCRLSQGKARQGEQGEQGQQGWPGMIRYVDRGREFELRSPVSSESTRSEALDDITRLVRGKRKWRAAATGALPLPKPVITSHILHIQLSCRVSQLHAVSNSLSFIMTPLFLFPLVRCHN
jgi:hypothetical protein